MTQQDKIPFQFVLDGFETAILLLDTQGAVCALNNAAVTFMQPVGENILGLPSWKLGWHAPQESEKKWRAALERAQRGERVRIDDRFAATTEAAGSQVNFSIAAIRDGGSQYYLAEIRTATDPIPEPAPAIPTLPQAQLPGGFALPPDQEPPAQQMAKPFIESAISFRLMVESIEDYAIFMVDLEGRIISWNRGAERLTGYTEKEALGQRFSILYPKEGTPEDHAAYELTMARRQGRYEEEGLRVRKNGSVYHALIMVWPVEDKAGNIIGFAKITRDVTERRRAEQALRNSEAKFRSITDAMPQMVWSSLPDGKWDFASQQWWHFTGISATATGGDGWLDLVHPDDRTAARDAWLASITTGRSYETQFRLKHSSNTFRWTLARALPVRNETGEITRWMGTVTDIHEQKRAEALLQESARRKDDFLAMLAHELRNPLGPIRNSTVLVRRLGGLDEQSVHAIDIIERQVRHMTRLIDDLLDVARISRGKIELRRETFDLGEVVRHTADDFRPEFERKNVQLQVEMPAQPLSLFADRTRIAQAIGNLLHNSLKFTPAQGEVSVSLAKVHTDGKTFAEVKVKDTGAGIDPELLEQLFLPFIQANQDLARSQGGLGLGLALIKGFIDLHDGKVQARSDGLNRGAEFGFQLPLATVPFAEANAQDSSSLAYSPLKILVIDDNRDMVETMVSLLSIDGHQVHSAYDGESGIELIREAKPDLVICDIGLPGTHDGYAVARAVRADPALNNLFMVALSGYGQEQDKRLSLESGFNAHLLKPVDFKSLAEMITTAGRLRER